MISLSKPAYLSLQDKQMKITFKGEEKVRVCPLDDLSYLIVDHPQITFSQRLLSALANENVALVICNEKHHPHGLMQPLAGHHIANERLRAQLNASVPLKKQLWKRVIKQKIINQGRMLAFKEDRKGAAWLHACSAQVKSGDQTGLEAQAARYYWKALWGTHFIRNPEHIDKNNAALNYGYAILRASVARALVGSGLLPLVSIHHTNRYNAYCLADDIMEPYRPFVDQLVCQMQHHPQDYTPLSKTDRKHLLQLPYLECQVKQGKTTLHLAIEGTTTSLAQSFVTGRSTTLSLPNLPFYGIDF